MLAGAADAGGSADADLDVLMGGSLLTLRHTLCERVRAQCDEVGAAGVAAF